MNSFVEYVTHDLLNDYDVKARAMFGGYGLSIDGVTFGMIVDDILYFKVNESNKTDYESYGTGAFTYTHKSGKKIAMSYYAVPSEVIDSPKILTEFMNKSLEIAKYAKKK